MKPLKLRPAFKEYLWGGTQINGVYNKQSGFERTAESWELSTHPDGLCTVAESGVPLAEMIAADPSMLGTARLSDELPILVKLIDAADDLSVQVHPNNEQARAWEKANGKTEMWYVIRAEQDAEILYGVKEDVSPEVFAEAIRNDTVLSLLERVPSRAGMTFFVEAGTVHAIGKGNLIAEVQQNSNVTYRLYDYGRRDKEGHCRPLHIEKGVRAAVLTKTAKVEPIVEAEGIRLLASCPYFEVRELTVNGELAQRCGDESYQCLLLTEGAVRVNDVAMNAGETVFLPAGLGEYTVNGHGTLLQVGHPKM